MALTEKQEQLVHELNHAYKLKLKAVFKRDHLKNDMFHLKNELAATNKEISAFVDEINSLISILKFSAKEIAEKEINDEMKGE